MIYYSKMKLKLRLTQTVTAAEETQVHLFLTKFNQLLTSLTPNYYYYHTHTLQHQRLHSTSEGYCVLGVFCL